MKLSIESAKWHYEKLLALHYFEYLTLAQKVSIFYHDLEHDILKEITGKKEYFEQFNCLKDNQIQVIRNIKKGDIPKVIIDDIDNLKNWRNESVHENKMPEPKYKNHLHTMAQTICFFSNVSIPEDINNVFNNQQKKNIVKGKNMDSEIKTNDALKRSELFKIFKEKISPDISYANTIYSNINKPTQLWWFELENIRFKDNINIILIDQTKKILYHFFIKGNTLKEPEKIFYQRNDNRKKNTSSIQLKAEDNVYFVDIKSIEKKFQFKEYLLNIINY